MGLWGKVSGREKRNRAKKKAAEAAAQARLIEMQNRIISENQTIMEGAKNSEALGGSTDVSYNDSNSNVELGVDTKKRRKTGYLSESLGIV